MVCSHPYVPEKYLYYCYYYSYYTTATTINATFDIGEATAQ